MTFLFKSALAIAIYISVSTHCAEAQDQEPDYLRSSLYTILVKSEAQNKRLDKENNKEAGNELIEIAKGVANTDAKKAANETSTTNLASIPAAIFTSIPIPPQFNDHNLNIRIVEFDAIREGMTQDQANYGREKLGMKKKGSFGKFAKALAGSVLETASGSQNSSMIQIDDVDEYTPAVLLKFIEDNNIPAGVLARWFDYDENTIPHWKDETLNERGLQSLSITEQGKDNENKVMAASSKAFNLIPNTFVIATNLRFRSNKAILAETQSLTNAIGSQFGDVGQFAALGAGAVASSAAGDGFSVQAVSHLFRIVWDENVESEMNKIFESNGTLQDLINSGVCRLEYVGNEKAGARVRQSIFSDKPISELVKRATTRAIDASIAKLQEKNEIFRSIFPISSVDSNGTIKVKIGTREGVSKNDTYAILEKIEDPKTGKINYKEIATVKPNEKMIWNNVADAEDEVAENNLNTNGKDKEFDDNAVSLGATTFVGKKGKDYSGCYVQLKKKK